MKENIFNLIIILGKIITKNTKKNAVVAYYSIIYAVLFLKIYRKENKGEKVT